MRVIALLSFYDEAPDFLIRAVGSATMIADHVIAVDGAYAQFPHEQPFSPGVQHEAINFAARAVGVGLTLYTPSAPWASETEKRTAMFRIAEAHAAVNTDWLFVIDADEQVTKMEMDAAELEYLPEDAAHVAFHDPYNSGTGVARRLFRCVPGLHVERAHYRYRDGQGRYLWGDATDDVVPAADLSGKVALVHRNHERDQQRSNHKREYYQQRAATGLEYGTCQHCHNNMAVIHLPTDLAPHPDGLAGSYGEYCAGCIPVVRKANRKALKAAGLDESVQCAINGRVYALRDLYPKKATSAA